MDKKYLLIVVLLMLLICGGAFIRSSKILPIGHVTESTSLPSNQFQYVPKWLTYHNEKYGFSVSYLDYQKIATRTENNSEVYGQYQWAVVKKGGLDYISFSDGDMWQSVVTIFQTDLSLKDFVSKKIEAEKKQNESYIANKITDGFLVSVIDRETTVSGYPAILYHGYIKGDAEHIAYRNLLVKTEKGVFDFSTRNGEPDFNKYFIESVSFDK